MTAFDQIMAHQRQTEALGKVMERLGWDQETMMPEGAADRNDAGVGGLYHDSILGRPVDSRQGSGEGGVVRWRRRRVHGD
jgi:carboxypeptidase Taq